jgi:hypothetical protein
MKNFEIGNIVGIDISIVLRNSPWLRRKVLSDIPQYMKGTIKRVATNGTIGVEFDTPIMQESISPLGYKGPGNLHGEGRQNYSMYVAPESLLNLELQDLVDDLVDDIVEFHHIDVSDDDCIICC